MSTSFTIVPLAGVHDRKSFSCGVEALDRYLQTQAGQDVRRHVANCYVLSPVNTQVVAGYYTFSATSLAVVELAVDDTRRLPRYPVLPAALVGRLAVDRQFRGKQLGAALLYDAMERAVRSEAAVFAIVVDAKNEAAAAFYRRHYFEPFAGRPERLYLPIATAIELLAK